MESPIDGQPAKRPRPKSGIQFPYYHLDDAIKVVEAIHNNAGDRARVDQVRGFLGARSVASGAFRTRLAASSMYGLVRTEANTVTLTDRAKAILSMHPEDAQQARVDAFLAVPLYARIYEVYRGRSLPPEVGIKRVIEELGVVRGQVDTAYNIFDKSSEQAGFRTSGKDYLVAPTIRPRDRGSTERRPSLTEPPSGTGGGATPPTGIHPALLGLLQLLPAPGTKWGRERKEWLQAFTATINVLYPDDGPGDS